MPFGFPARICPPSGLLSKLLFEKIIPVVPDVFLFFLQFSFVIKGTILCKIYVLIIFVHLNNSEVDLDTHHVR